MMMRKKTISSLCISLSLVVLVGHSVGALSRSEFYSDQDILTYDKDAVAAVCTPTGADTSTPLIAPNGQNVQTGYQYFIGKGFTPEQSAGILGNLLVESGMDPNINQLGGGPGRGIAQWEAGSGGRWTALVQFARDQNRSERDLYLQLDFIWFELQGSEKRAYDHLLGTKTVDQATLSFLTKYERAGDPNLARRYKEANDTYAKYNGLPGIGGSESSGGCAASSVSGGSIVQIAEAEFAKGIVERPARCDEGNPSISGTCGPEIDKYTDSTLEYWCADFLSWVFKTAGTPFTGGASGGWRIASVDGVRAWFQKNGTFYNSGQAGFTPQPGDVVIYNYSHADVVVAVNGDSIVTIGGNTGVGDVQNGSGVGKKTTKINSSSIVGFGRLK